MFETHLIKRGWSPQLRVWTSFADELVYFPLFGWNDKLLGYQRYDWRAEKLGSNKGRYFTWITKGYADCTVYGYDSLWKFPEGPVFLNEGAWNATTCHNNGYASLSLLTATPSKALREWVLTVCANRRRIALLDNDPKSVKQTLDRMADVCYNPPYGKDVNDLSHKDATLWLRTLI
jgi:hypothetical protein